MPREGPLDSEQGVEAYLRLLERGERVIKVIEAVNERNDIEPARFELWRIKGTDNNGIGASPACQGRHRFGHLRPDRFVARLFGEVQEMSERATDVEQCLTAVRPVKQSDQVPIESRPTVEPFLLCLLVTVRRHLEMTQHFA